MDSAKVREVKKFFIKYPCYKYDMKNENKESRNCLVFSL